MAATKKSSAKDPKIAAVEAVHRALRDLSPAERSQVVSSVANLLDITTVPSTAQTISGLATVDPRAAERMASRPESPPQRRLSLVELVAEKMPGTHVQRITLFAYYRERVEGTTYFERNDLRSYFAMARISPPQNYDRDFGEAVKKGWIHEDGSQSYVTSKGIEAVETGFPGQRKVLKPRRIRQPKRKKKSSIRTSSRKKTGKSAR